MSADQDKASKTEEPTQRRLDEARRKGDVAKTPDLPQFLALAGASAVVLAMGGDFTRTMTDALTPFIARPDAFSLNGSGGVEVYRLAAQAAAPVLLAVFVAAGLAGAGGHLIQHGFLLTGERLQPKWSKISPVGGFKRIFGPDGLMEFAKTFTKLCVIGVIAWFIFEPHAREFETLAALHPAAILAETRDLLAPLLGGVLAFLAAASAIDWLWQRHRWMKRQRMSLQEVKDDYKQSDGDPHVKARQKQIRNERARRRMMTDVASATVVVMNPTHFAVALRYDDTTPAPKCVAKGVDTLALKIRATAEEAGVPVVEDAPLARSLHRSVDVDDVIPREHFEAVAKIIGFVMNRGRSGGARPPRP